MKDEPCEYSYHDRYHKITDTPEEILTKLKKMWAEAGDDFEEDGEWVPEFKKAHARWTSCPHCVKARKDQKYQEERRKELAAEEAERQEQLKVAVKELTSNLLKYLDELKDAHGNGIVRFAEQNWDEQFRLMDEDPAYTPIQKQKDLRAGYEGLFRRAGEVVDSTIKDLLRQVQTEESAITAAMRRIMREKWEAADEVVRPCFLYCERCEVFGDFNDEGRNHLNRECKPNLNCKHCGHKSTTYDRHRAHINLKHLKKWKHKCEACAFGTDSKTAIERHNHCASHLEKAGTPKPREFRCEACDKTFRFRSEMERHAVSKRHGATLRV